MTTVLGKRKARSSATAPTKPAISQEEAQEIFRRHFEAQFAPLEEMIPSTAEAENIEDMRSDAEDNDEDDEWDGLSAASGETPETNKVQVVDYTQTNTATTTALAAALSKREAKAYLSSKVLLSSTTDGTKPIATTSKKSKTPTDEDSADLLKNDLALQRLLAESHLLNPTKNAGSQIGAAVTTEHSGRNRHRATDLRLTALGGKSSIFRQEKMPMSHRKGIEGARQDREARRRREAKENGIILEREAPASSSKKSGGGAGGGSGGKRGGGSRREKAVDAPAVGRMSNGMLRLSQRDIDEIQGPSRSGGNMKKRRR